jgi:hypothetical protein
MNYKQANNALLNDIKKYLTKNAYVPMQQQPQVDPNMPLNPSVRNQYMMQGMDPNMMQGMDPNMMQGMDPNMMQGMDPNMMQGMDPNMMQGMDPNMMQGMDPYMMQGMDPNMIQGMDPNMIQEEPQEKPPTKKNKGVELELIQQNLDFVNQKLDLILNLLIGGQASTQPTKMAMPQEQGMPIKQSKEQKQYSDILRNLMR